MFRKIIYALILVALLSACTSSPEDEELDIAPPGLKNPKNAKVEVLDGTVSIRLPGHPSYFWLEKVNDDSVEFSRMSFKYDGVEQKYFFQTNLADWQPLILEEDTVEMGLVKIVFEEGQILVTYPSGTWAFP